MITSILRWIRNRLKRKTINSLVDENIDIIGSITFKLLKDKNINISCYITETKDFSVNELTELSEDYAELMMCINEGLLATEIIKFIKESIEATEFEQDKLFFENVLAFWSIHYANYIKQKRAKLNQPLIKPSAVFGP